MGLQDISKCVPAAHTITIRTKYDTHSRNCEYSGTNYNLAGFIFEASLRDLFRAIVPKRRRATCAKTQIVGDLTFLSVVLVVLSLQKRALRVIAR